MTIKDMGTRAVEEQRCDRTNRKLMMWEPRKKAKDAKRMRGIVHENDKAKRSCQLRVEVGKLTHHGEHALLSLWQGWHWDDTKGGWFDQEHCAKARREEVYIRNHQRNTSVPGRCGCVRQERAHEDSGWRLTRDNQGSPTSAQGGSRGRRRHM